MFTVQLRTLGNRGTGEESQLTQKLVGEYTGCTAFGSSATVSPAEYELSADETVSIINKTIVITVKVAGCSIEVKPQNNLKGIRYLIDPNSGNTRLLAHAEVEKIVSTTIGGGTTCGGEGEHTAGLYRGLLLALVDGGALSWV